MVNHSARCATAERCVCPRRLNWKARSAQLAADVPDWVANIGDALESADGVSLGSAPIVPSTSRPASGRLGQTAATSADTDWLNDLSLEDSPLAAQESTLDASWLTDEVPAQADWLTDAEPAAPVDPSAWLNTGSLDASMLPSEADLQAAALSIDPQAPADPMAWLGTSALPAQPAQPALTSDQSAEEDFESFFLRSLEQDPSEITQLSIPTAPVKLPTSASFAFDAPDTPQEQPDLDLFSTFEASAPATTEDTFDVLASNPPAAEPPPPVATVEPSPNMTDFGLINPINPTADDAGFWDTLNAVESRTIPTIQSAPPPSSNQAPSQPVSTQLNDFEAMLGDASALSPAEAADVDLESSLSRAASSEAFDVDSLALDQFDDMALDAFELGDRSATDFNAMPEMPSATTSSEAMDSGAPDLDAPLNLPWLNLGNEASTPEATAVSPLDSASLLDELDWLAPVEDLGASAELNDTDTIGDPNALISELGLSPVDEAPISSQSLLDETDLAEFEKLRAETGSLSEQSPSIFPPRESTPETPAGQLSNTAMLAWLSANSEPNLIPLDSPEEEPFEPPQGVALAATSAITPPHEIELEDDWFAAFESELDRPALTPSHTGIAPEEPPSKPASEVLKSEPLFEPGQSPVAVEGTLGIAPSDEAEMLTADLLPELASEGTADGLSEIEEDQPAVGDANWLARVRGSTKSLSRSETGVLNAADAPDWLAAFGATPPATPTEPAPVAASQPDDLGGLDDLGELNDLGESRLGSPKCLQKLPMNCH